MKQFEITIQGDAGSNLEPFYCNFISLEEARRKYPWASIKEMEIPIKYEELTNKQKFMAIVDWRPTSTMQDIKDRIKNRHWISIAQKIALDILTKNDELKFSKEDIAEKLNLSLEDVNLIFSGKYNLDLNLLSKIEELFKIKIFTKNIKKFKNSRNKKDI